MAALAAVDAVAVVVAVARVQPTITATTTKGIIAVEASNA